MHPSRRALAVFAFGVALALVPSLGVPELWRAWVLFWVLALSALGLDAVLAARASDLRHELALPDTLTMGGTHVAALTLSLRAGGPTAAEVKLDLSENLRPQPAQRAALSTAGARLDVQLEPLRRGRAEIEAAWIRYPGPLGFIVRKVRLPIQRSVSAVPNLPGVHGAAIAFSSRDGREGIKLEHYAGDGSEFESLKEFDAGSDSRTIDWKASARHTKLLRRQFRAERNHSIVFAIDTSRLMAEPLAGVPRLDHAIHAALLLAYVSTRSGDRVSLFSFDERPRVFLEPRGGVAAFRALTQLTSELAYTDAEANYTLGLTNLMTRLTRRSLVIVLTEFVDTISAELMVENVKRLSNRHLVVFVSLRDPLLAALLGSEPARVLDLNRAVVAGSLLRERELVLLRLRRHGVFCIDAPPQGIGAALLNRYLEIKRRELI
jgi:uncharacterized protein (DUF58 family)